MNARLIGNLVQVRVENRGAMLCWGIAEYVTDDGYVGVRQRGGAPLADGGNRLDEFPVSWIRPDKT
jgi:hypothetical protein